MKSDTQKTLLPTAALAAVGDVITSASALDAAIAQHLISFAAGEPPSMATYLPAFLLTAGMATETALGLLKTFVRMEFSDQAADDFDALADCISKAYRNRRNIAAHKMWAPGRKPDRLKVWNIKSVGALKFDPYDVTIKELHDWAEDFRAFSRKLDAFMKQHNRHLARELPPDE